MTAEFAEQLKTLMLKAQEPEFISEITDAHVLKAKNTISTNGYSTTDFFLLLASINLLNAAIKRPAYKKAITYFEIKGNASRILSYLARLSINRYELDFYINEQEKCAYVEIFDLQFSFHNIAINHILREYINSERNKIKPWKEIRLQKIAGELFDLAMAIKMNNAFKS